MTVPENTIIEALKPRIDALKKRKDIPEINKKQIIDFVEYQVGNGLGIKRLYKYFSVLPRFSIWFGKDFKKVDKEDT